MVDILLSNDDGVYAKGLNVLAKHLKSVGNITIFAPDRNRSGASNSLTLDRPLRVKTIDENIFSIEGTPTDCVHLALSGLMPKKPDIVISGINEGSNLGDDVWYSGTVAAAMEGRFLGLPAIALSLTGKNYQHYETGALIAKLILQRLLHEPLPGTTILNVNIPDIPYDQLQGFEITRLGSYHCSDKLVADKDPRGKPIYWIGPQGAELDNGPGTDFYAISMNKVSVTPLRLDLTQYKVFDQLAQWFNGFGQTTLNKASSY